MKEYIWVFKTNIQHADDVLNIADVLNAETISRWTIDTEDCDAVLRVVTTADAPDEIMFSITNKGYLCSELTD